MRRRLDHDVVRSRLEALAACGFVLLGCVRLSRQHYVRVSGSSHRFSADRRLDHRSSIAMTPKLGAKHPAYTRLLAMTVMPKKYLRQRCAEGASSK